jgi:hypothetical protein
MKRLLSTFSILWWVFLVGCAGEKGTPFYQSTKTISRTNIPWVTSSPKTAETSSLLAATDTGTSTPAVPPITPTSQPGVVQSCIKIQPGLIEKNDYTGTIAFETHDPPVVNVFSFFDFKTGKFSKIIGKDMMDFSTSPDRSMYAYENFGTHRLEIFSADRKSIKSLMWGVDWGNIAGWLDNQRIIIAKSEAESPGSHAAKYPRSDLAINPFTNQTKTLLPDYPNIDKASENTSWGNFGTTVYDSTLSRVIYPGLMKLSDYKGMGYILYGINEKKILAQIPSVTWNQLPLWFSDGSQFIVMGDDEFYRVSYNGQITRISHMNPDFAPKGKNKIDYLIEYYSLSPDDKHVALWLVDFTTKRGTLAILDTHTGEVTDTCILAGYNPFDIGTFPYPTWSPDGRELVVAANYRPNDNSHDVALIDLEKQAAYIITTNLFPVGWLISP